jgi:hypothetical protein
MHPRSKVFAIESVTVMLVMIIFALVVFLVINAGSSAYNTIIDDKQSTENARVAYSYINMKIRQSDAAGCIDVVETEFGNTLKIDIEDGEYCTYIFFSDGALYECLTFADKSPAVSAANKITALSGFSLERSGSLISMSCVCDNGDTEEIMEGTVGLRT